MPRRIATRTGGCSTRCRRNSSSSSSRKWVSGGRIGGIPGTRSAGRSALGRRRRSSWKGRARGVSKRSKSILNRDKKHATYKPASGTRLGGTGDYQPSLGHLAPGRTGSGPAPPDRGQVDRVLLADLSDLRQFIPQQRGEKPESAKPMKFQGSGTRTAWWSGTAIAAALPDSPSITAVAAFPRKQRRCTREWCRRCGTRFGRVRCIFAERRRIGDVPVRLSQRARGNGGRPVAGVVADGGLDRGCDRLALGGADRPRSRKDCSSRAR
jgi:hypothetical protein